MDLFHDPGVNVSRTISAAIASGRRSREERAAEGALDSGGRLLEAALPREACGLDYSVLRLVVHANEFLSYGD
jgi:hypothetical protein